MQNKKIVLLAGKWDTTPIVYNYVGKEFPVSKVIMEEPVPRMQFLKKRIKKLGWLNVIGQVSFQLLVGKILSFTSRKRICQIISDYDLSTEPIPPGTIFPVESVNSDNCLKLLKEIQPDIVVVHGTRIISKNILENTGATFVNIHAGITPKYRGSHGAYWALANNDKENCGVTVHLVDPGIDTGNIIFQENIPVTSEDNFTTYGYLQLAVGLKLLKKAIPLIIEKKVQTIRNGLDSSLWHHPVIWQYLYKRIFKGIK
jgi:methionyl-tRNA formyltransferase